MKVATKSRRWLMPVGVVLTLALLAGPSTPTGIDNVSPVIPPTSRLTYRVYQELAVDWWNWLAQFPFATNPAADTTGEFGHLGQRGPVWFLAGTFGGSATRELTVPEGRGLFFPIVNAVFWAPEDGDTPRELRDLANDNIDEVTLVECSINGKVVKGLLQKYRVETPPFTLHLPEGGLFDDFGFEPGDRFPAVTDGYWVLVSPLPRGKHVIHFRGVNGDFEVDVTYNLTVVRSKN